MSSKPLPLSMPAPFQCRSRRKRLPTLTRVLGCYVTLLLVPIPAALADTATVNLNNGNCSDRVGVPDPCNVTDPTLAEAAYVIGGVENAAASADVTSGTLRARTESIDLDTDVPDGAKLPAPPCPEPPPPEPNTCSDSTRMLLQSPSGALPDLQVLDRVAINHFANMGNNGDFVVVAVETPRTSYVLRREYGSMGVGPNESDVAIEVTRNEEFRPLATATIEQVVLNYTDENPYEIESGKIGMSFNVRYDRLNIPADPTQYDVRNELLIGFNARLDEPSGSTGFSGALSHSIDMDESNDDGDPPGVEHFTQFISPNMQFVETERSADGISGRFETTVPIALDMGDTLTIVSAYFWVGSAGDLVEDDPDPTTIPVPISISDGSMSAHLYGDFPPGLVSNTEEPIDWPREPPVEEQILDVAVDIKPGEASNCVNINDHGVIPVAILGSTELDATQIDASTLDFNGMSVRLLGNDRPSCTLRDADGDGFLDTVCRFEDAGSEWTGGESDAVITGSLFDGTAFRGVDSICLLPPESSSAAAAPARGRAKK